jgi:hypothetical protein
MAFTSVTVTQDFTSADGTEPSGTVTFTPSAALVNSGVVIPAVPVTGRLSGSGVLSIDLMANTDSGTAPAGSTYRVVELINDVARSYSIQVPHNGSPPLTLYSLIQA